MSAPVGRHRRPGSHRPASAPAPAYRLVEDDAGFAEVLEALAAAEAYALDTEFHRERTYFPHLALLQLAVVDEIFVVDPLAVDVAPLGRVLDGPGLAVLHAAEQDLEVLDRACGTVPGRLFDTQLAAGFVGMSTPSLGSLAERLLGVRLEKGDQLTDWTRRPLTSGQLAYAASDVAHLLEARAVLCEQLEQLGRRTWAEEECATLLGRSRGPAVPEEAWWRLKHARQLRGRDRGVAQSVAAWRERRAQQIDQPVRYVLPDLALVAIAHRPPSSRRELETVRGLDGRHLGGAAAEGLLEAVAAGLALDPPALRLPPGPGTEPVARPAAALGAAFVAERARQVGIDTSLLATRADLAAFFRERPEGRLVTTWRRVVVGEPLRRLASGEVSLALDEAGDLVLEERSFRPAGLGAPDAAAELGNDGGLTA
ncbi:MAG: HRDC domain-containing protein [Actinomycetota bacterium]|nr:HRDC domain-containing protein [Actinomycetota bacterium]